MATVARTALYWYIEWNTHDRTPYPLGHFFFTADFADFLGNGEVESENTPNDDASVERCQDRLSQAARFAVCRLSLMWRESARETIPRDLPVLSCVVYGNKQ